ncbi:LysM peptidoglycan-binding domain-containing protein [bacterium]|nr:LysM peptidoglycan-binding domain-containing protein [bacterium]
MKLNKNLRILAILSIFSLFTFWLGAPQTARAQGNPAGTAAEMLAEINAYRASNGLPPMEENVLLNIAAQNHADWIAAGNPGGHTGAGGSSPTDRAAAVGYDVSWVTENWARGYGLTVSNCVYVMWDDPAHNDNMLDPNRKEFGAGVALDQDGMTVYVVDFSNFDTNGDQPGGYLPDTNTTVTPSGPTATFAPLIQPVMTSTPSPDGSVIHIVQYGQTLWTISDAYGVPLADILALNGLTEDSSIFPEEQLLIVQGTGETPQPTETAGTPTEEEPTEVVTPTITPTATERGPQVTITVTPDPEEAEPSNNFLTNIFSGDTLWVGIGLVAVSVFGIVLLLFTSARLR